MTDLAVPPAAPAAAPAAALMSAPPMSTPAPPLTISPDFLRLLGKSEQEVRIELAIFFYKEYQISPGKAGAIAGLSRIEFWEELGKRKIPINYGCGRLHARHGEFAPVQREISRQNPPKMIVVSDTTTLSALMRCEQITLLDEFQERAGFYLSRVVRDLILKDAGEL